MFQSRLPGNRVIPDSVERRRLMKIGAEMNHAVEHTLGIVSIKTYRLWLREERGGRQQQNGNQILHRSNPFIITYGHRSDHVGQLHRGVGHLKPSWICEHECIGVLDQLQEAWWTKSVVALLPAT